MGENYNCLIRRRPCQNKIQSRNCFRFAHPALAELELRDQGTETRDGSESQQKVSGKSLECHREVIRKSQGSQANVIGMSSDILREVIENPRSVPASPLELSVRP